MRPNTFTVVALMCMLLPHVNASAIPQNAGIQAKLSEKDIADAIEFGTTGRPEPYLIRHYVPPNVPNTYAKIVASVYTPFIRVALVARTSASKGARLMPSGVGRELTEAVAYVVYRWSCCDEGVSEPIQQSQVKVATPGVERFLERYRLPKPLAVRYDVASVLAALDLGMPPPDAVAIVTYPIESIRPETHFVIYRDLDPESVPQWIPAAKLRAGQIRSVELMHWR